MSTLTLIKREIKLSIRNFGLILSYSSFFLLSLLIFTFGVGPDLEQLNTVYIPIIWVIMLFAIILVSDNFLLSDFQDGSLKEMQYLGYSEESIILSKTVVMYLVLITPHFFLIPIFSIFYKFLKIENIYLSTIKTSRRLINEKDPLKCIIDFFSLRK